MLNTQTSAHNNVLELAQVFSQSAFHCNEKSLCFIMYNRQAFKQLKAAYRLGLHPCMGATSLIPCAASPVKLFHYGKACFFVWLFVWLFFSPNNIHTK